MSTRPIFSKPIYEHNRIAEYRDTTSESVPSIFNMPTSQSESVKYLQDARERGAIITERTEYTRYGIPCTSAEFFLARLSCGKKPIHEGWSFNSHGDTRTVSIIHTTGFQLKQPCKTADCIRARPRNVNYLHAGAMVTLAVGMAIVAIRSMQG